MDPRPFISMTEAAVMAKVNRGKVRRRINAIVASDNHPQRGLVKPSPSELKLYKKSKTYFEFTVSPALVETLFAAEMGLAVTPPSHDTSTPTDDVGEHAVVTHRVEPDDPLLVAKQEMIENLKEQLLEKKKEIETRDKQLEAADDRLRESHEMLCVANCRYEMLPAVFREALENDDVKRLERFAASRHFYVSEIMHGVLYPAWWVATLPSRLLPPREKVIEVVEVTNATTTTN